MSLIFAYFARSFTTSFCSFSSWRFPNANSRIATKIHVAQGTRLVHKVKTKSLTNHDVPGLAKLFVHRFLEKFGGALSNTKT